MASRYTARSYNGGAPAAALTGAGAGGARDAGSASGCDSVGPAATRSSQRTSTPRTADADAKRRRTSGGSTAHGQAPPSREGAPAQDTPSTSGVAAPTAAPPAAHAGLTPPHTGAADGARAAVEPLTAEALRERADLVILRDSSGPAASGRPSMAAAVTNELLGLVSEAVTALLAADAAAEQQQLAPQRALREKAVAWVAADVVGALLPTPDAAEKAGKRLLKHVKTVWPTRSATSRRAPRSARRARAMPPRRTLRWSGDRSLRC